MSDSNINAIEENLGILSRLQKENELLRGCVEFYSSQDSWTEIVDRNNIYGTIIGDFYQCEHEGARFGGLKAKECLAKLGER